MRISDWSSDVCSSDLGTVEQRDLDVHDRIAGHDAALDRVPQALVDARDEFLRNHAADDVVDELVTLARLLRLDTEPHVAELSLAARLLGVLAFLLDGLADGLAVSNLRRADLGFDVVLTQIGRAHV